MGHQKQTNNKKKKKHNSSFPRKEIANLSPPFYQFSPLPPELKKKKIHAYMYTYTQTLVQAALAFKGATYRNKVAVDNEDA